MRRVAWVVTFCILIAGCGTMESEIPSAVRGEFGLPPAPEFDLAAFSGGTIASEELRGRVVIADFWATWCTYCIAEVPEYNAIHREQNPEEVVVLGIAVESGSFEDVAPRIKEFGMEYAVVMGNLEVLQGFGGTTGYPVTWVVTPDWKIYKKYFGALPNKRELLERDIRDLLARAAPTATSE